MLQDSRAQGDEQVQFKAKCRVPITDRAPTVYAEEKRFWLCQRAGHVGTEEVKQGFAVAAELATRPTHPTTHCEFLGTLTAVSRPFAVIRKHVYLSANSCSEFCGLIFSPETIIQRNSARIY